MFQADADNCTKMSCFSCICQRQLTAACGCAAQLKDANAAANIFNVIKRTGSLDMQRKPACINQSLNGFVLS